MDQNAASSSSPKSQPAAQPSSYDWERIRPVFEDLYQKRGLPLREVKNWLEAEYNFTATERMFKTRIRNWHLDKNKKEDEMLAVLRKLKQREAQGRDTLFVIRGRQITADDVYQYLGRKGIRWTDIDLRADDSAVWARNDIEFSTPVGTPTFRPEAGELSLIEELELDTQVPPVISPLYLDVSSVNFLRSIEMYYSTMFVNGGWAQTELNDLPPMTFGGEFLKFHNLWMLKRTKAAFHVLNNAYDMIKDLLVANHHPRMLIYLLESIAFTRSVGHEQVALQLIKFFMLMSKSVLLECHPITQFAAGLCQADRVFLSGMIDVGLEAMIAQFKTYAGPDHPETMALLLTSSSILKHQKSYLQASTRLDQLLLLYEQAYGRESYQASHALADHAAVKTELAQYENAEMLLEQAMRRAEGIHDAQGQAESRIRCLINLATLRQAQGDIPATIHTLQMALSLGEDGKLENDHWMMRHVRALMAAAQLVSGSPSSTCSVVMLTPPSDSSL